MPATTGLWAKVYIIEGVVGTPGGDALAVIAMVSAVIAAFFYLRLVLYMVSGPVLAPGTETVGDPIYEPAPASSPVPASEPQPSSELRAGMTDSAGGGSAANVATLETLEAAQTAAMRLTSDGTELSEDTQDRKVVPLSIATAIAICAGFTVLFGLWPSPIINFAHAATLLLH
jgi:formate hydrogenlyase subunit 3/multisubunit Na+/H+ antiporter MnhD subunit